MSLIAEHSERVTEKSSGLFAKSLVKSVVIGDVPDRGGRTTSLRTKISTERKADFRQGGGQSGGAGEGAGRTDAQGGGTASANGLKRGADQKGGKLFKKKH